MEAHFASITYCIIFPTISWTDTFLRYLHTFSVRVSHPTSEFTKRGQKEGSRQTKVDVQS